MLKPVIMIIPALIGFVAGFIYESLVVGFKAGQESVNTYFDNLPEPTLDTDTVISD